jgi:hypothetical protein
MTTALLNEQNYTYELTPPILYSAISVHRELRRMTITNPTALPTTLQFLAGLGLEASVIIRCIQYLETTGQKATQTIPRTLCYFLSSAVLWSKLNIFSLNLMQIDAAATLGFTSNYSQRDITRSAMPVASMRLCLRKITMITCFEYGQKWKYLALWWHALLWNTSLRRWVIRPQRSFETSVSDYPIHAQPYTGQTESFATSLLKPRNPHAICFSTPDITACV